MDISGWWNCEWFLASLLFSLFSKFSSMSMYFSLEDDIKNKIVPNSHWVSPAFCSSIISSLNNNYSSFSLKGSHDPLIQRRVFHWGSHCLKDTWERPIEKATHFFPNAFPLPLQTLNQKIWGLFHVKSKQTNKQKTNPAPTKSEVLNIGIKEWDWLRVRVLPS